MPRWHRSLLGKAMLCLLGAVLLAYSVGAGIGFMVVERVSREQWRTQATTYAQISASALRNTYTAISVQSDPDGRITRIVSDQPIGDAESILQTGFNPVDVLALAAAQTLNNVWLFRYDNSQASPLIIVSAFDGTGTQDTSAEIGNTCSLTPGQLDKPYLGFAVINNHEYFVSATPIATRAGKQTGALVSSIGTREELYHTRNALIFNSLLALVAVLLLATVAIVWLVRRTFRPVPRLIQALMRITRGDIQAATPHLDRTDEIGQLASAIETLRKAVAEREQLLSIQETARRLDHMAHHDALTGMPNRAFLDRSLARSVSRLSAGVRFNVMLFDLDRFKEVNDSHGHATGDALLVAVSDRLNLLLGPDDIAARLGGDEFVVVQQVARDARLEAEKLAEHIIETLRRPFLIDNLTLNIGVSIGITRAPEDGDNAHDLMKKADIALYAAKNAGRGRYFFHEFCPPMGTLFGAPLP